MRYLFILSLFLLSALYSFGQMSKADQAFEQLNYFEAYDLYKKAYGQNKSNLALERIVMCCKYLNLYNENELWAQKWTLVDGKNANAFYAYGEALISMGKYKEAKQAFETSESLTTRSDLKKDAVRQQQRCDTAYKRTIAPENRVTVTPVAALNTPYSEWGLVKYFGGYVFSSDRVVTRSLADSEGKIAGSTGRPYFKMFTVKYDEDDNIFKDVNLFSDQFNGDYHTAGPAFTESQSTVYFTRTRVVPMSESGTIPVMRLEIFYAESFKDVKPFKHNSVLKYSVGDPAINADGTRLYFVSDMPGGYGGNDIYYCDRTPQGEWGPVVNLGPDINTAGDERFPMLMNDNTMFYSSNGLFGLGGLDIYRATRINDKWQSAYHMDYPINSPQDDFGFTITKVRRQPGEPGMVILEGFLSSDRMGGKGADDIYRFKAIMPQFLTDYVYKGRLLDSETGAPISDVNISVTNKETNKTEEYKSTKDGRYEFPLAANQDFDVTMKKKNFFTVKQTISTDNTDGSTPEKLNIEFDRIVINKAIVLDNIYWDFGKSTITPQSKSALDKLVDIMLDNPDIKIEVSSHTDNIGSDDINLKMSQQRAQAVLDYLVLKGVASSRVKAKGYGKKMPVIDCGNNCTEEENAKNRRTEFKVTSMEK